MTGGLWAVVPVFDEASTHVRALIVLPLLLLAETLMDRRSEEAGHYLLHSGLVAPQRLDGLRDAIARTARMRDSILDEGALLLVAVVTIVTLPPSTSALDVELLTRLARACADEEQLRFEYSDHQGVGSRRLTEPYRLLHAGGRWYLVAWDVEREDWRTFRVDRVHGKVVVGPPFTRRAEPPPDLLDKVSRSIERAPWQYRARVKVHAPATVLANRLPKAVELEPIDDQSCIVSVGSDGPEHLVRYLTLLPADFEVLDAPELAPHLQRLARRLSKAARSAEAK